jgi:hypothetical protein
LCKIEKDLNEKADDLQIRDLLILTEWYYKEKTKEYTKIISIDISYK